MNTPGRNLKYKCETCEIIFPSKSSYQRHRRDYYDLTINQWMPHNSSEMKRARLEFSSPASSTELKNPFQEISSSSDSESEIDTLGCEELPTTLSYSEHEIEEDGTDKDNIADRESSDISESSSDQDSQSESDSEQEVVEDGDGEEIFSLEDLFVNDKDNTNQLKLQVSKIERVNVLLEWIVYFIIFWQASCHISDSSVDWLLKFLSNIFKVLGTIIGCSFMSDIAKFFPSSMFLLRKLGNVDRDDYVKYVVCPKCTCLYHFHQCIEKDGNRHTAKSCQNIIYKKKCNAQLIKSVKTKDGLKHYPIKVYCYNSIINQLEKILCRKDNTKACEDWRSQFSYNLTNAMSDIYDGQVWRDFQYYNDKPFLAAERNYALGLNVDWFQPFKNRNDYSVGVIYFTLLNLPRSKRYKFENIIVAGILPALSKEPNLNSFFKPILAELDVLWSGLKLKTSLSSVSLTVRAAILCVICDVPAARKVGGFKGHSGLRGCSKCYKLFPGGFKEKRNYSGFDRTNWEKRTKFLHKRHTEILGKCKTKKSYMEKSKEYGVNYSILNTLEYFNAVRFVVIDPMHNLFLGTSKMFFKTILKLSKIKQSDLVKIENRIKSMCCTSDIGRIPTKISSNYGKFTADEWRNWTCVYSIYSLQEILPEQYLKCWEKFVLACRIICKPVITKMDVQKADALLLNFCKMFENLFGSLSVTPNMHLHCHLKECLYDYGPVQSFWCYSFERYNNYFGQIPTNNKLVEVQFMRKLNILRCTENWKMPSEYSVIFNPLFEKLHSTEEFVDLSPLLYSTLDNFSIINWSDLSLLKLPSWYNEYALTTEDIQCLLSVYNKMYQSFELIEVHLPSSTKRYTHIHIAGEKFGSKREHRSLVSARILASWIDNDLNIDISNFNLRPCKVDWYFSHKLCFSDGTKKEHVFACVSWYKQHEEKHKYGKSLEVWSQGFEPGGLSRFLPVQRIHSRFSCVENSESIVVSSIGHRIKKS